MCGILKYQPSIKQGLYKAWLCPDFFCSACVIETASEVPQKYLHLWSACFPYPQAGPMIEQSQPRSPAQVDLDAVLADLQSLKAPDRGPPDPVSKLWPRHISSVVWFLNSVA